MSKKKRKKIDQSCTECGNDCDPLLLYPLPLDKWQRKPDEKQLAQEKAIKKARERGMPLQKKTVVNARKGRKARLCPACLKKWHKAYQEKHGTGGKNAEQAITPPG